jgi:hypothetical protein
MVTKPGGCNTGYFDINGLYSDGCECPDTAYATSCNSATSLGTLAYNDSRTVTSQLPASGNEAAWFAVQFASNNSLSYFPQVRFTQGGGEYVFDVLLNCVGALAYACNTAGDAANATHLTNFSVKTTAGDPGGPGGQCGNNSRTGNCTSPYNLTPAVGNNGFVYVKVYRANTAAVSCNPFTIVFSD